MKSLLLFILSVVALGLKSQTTIIMYKEGGVSFIPCKINGHTLDLIFDTGASDVSLSLAEASYMFESGKLTSKDILGKATYSDASGDSYDNIVVNLKELEIAGLILTDVRASISKSVDAPLLLGQSAISKLGTLQINLSDNSLVIGKGNGFFDYTTYYTQKGKLVKPNVIDEYFASAQKKYSLHNYRGAIEDYTKCLELNPKSRAVYNNRALCRLNLKKYQEALSDINNALAIDSQAYYSYVNRGNIYSEIRDYEKALRDYKTAYRIKPDCDTVIFNLGLYFYEVRDYDNSVILLNKCLLFNPAFKEAISILSSSYDKRGISKVQNQDSQGALKDFTKAVEINPKYAGGYYNRGLLKYNIQNYQGAIDDYSLAIEINPKFSEAFFNRAIVKNKLQNYQGAIDDYTKTIALTPRDPEAFFNRGNSKRKLQDNQGAIEDYSLAIEINPKFSEAFLNRGYAKNKLQNYQGAIDDYTQVISINPRDAQAYCNRGISYFNNKNVINACKDWQIAFKLNNTEAKDFLDKYCK